MSGRARLDLIDTDPIHDGRVYFIDDGAGLIKIGYTTDIGKRLTDLRTSSASDLILVEYALAGRDVEKEIHRLLASERLRREWFRQSDKVLDLIDLIGDFLEQFDDDDEDIDGRDNHVLTVDELRSMVAKPYYWMTE